MRLLPHNQVDLTREEGETQSYSDAQEDWETTSGIKEDFQRETMMPSLPIAGAPSPLCRPQRGPTTCVSPTHCVEKSRKPPIVKEWEPEEASANGVRFTASFSFDTKGSILKIWMLPLSLSCILTWMVYQSTLPTTFAPLCIIPGISQTMLCAPIEPVPIVDFGRLVNIQGSAFEQLVEESPGSSQSSIKILRAEKTTRDLSLLVYHRNLKSEDDITDMLHTIGTDAKKTGQGLSRLDATVVGAIDEVIALNNNAMAAIENADKKVPPRFLQAISPVKLGPSAEEIATEAFMLAIRESEQVIGKLVLEAEMSSQNLERLDTVIGVLHEMILVEDEYTTAKRDKLLGELWTKLGGNEKAVQDYDDDLALLKTLEALRRNLSVYTKVAGVHVGATLRVLDTTTEDLEVLREQVATPGLLNSKVPLHSHVESIRNGLERLQGEIARKFRNRGPSSCECSLQCHDFRPKANCVIICGECYL